MKVSVEGTRINARARVTLPASQGRVHVSKTSSHHNYILRENQIPKLWPKMGYVKLP